MDALLEFAAAGPVMMTTPPLNRIVARYANDKGDIFEVKHWRTRPDGTPTRPDDIYVVRRSTKFDYHFVRFIGDDHDVIIRKVTRRSGEVELVRLTFMLACFYT